MTDGGAATPPTPTSRRPRSLARLLALDTASPRLSVAVGAPGAPRACRDAPASRSSAAIMRLLDECLAEAGLAPADLDGLLVLAGPGGFTGLRVGMALAMGLHQALGLPVGTLTTFETLAATAPAERQVVAAVPAGRGRWHLQPFDPVPPGSPRLASDVPESAGDDEVAERSRHSQVVGFGVGLVAPGAVEPPPHAATALGLVAASSWDPAELSHPRYMAPPPANPAARV
jgi:tRNA threonylcarbamoyladenosine biosynthesis protein TsaB